MVCEEGDVFLIHLGDERVAARQVDLGLEVGCASVVGGMGA